MRATAARRARLSIDVTPEARRRIRIAAARRDQSIREYVIEAVQARLREDLGSDRDGIMGLTREADPVLADLWDNERDAAYDDL
jgi:uncharacterized protein (DUF1778 family)